jgi:hypothetical protein
MIARRHTPDQQLPHLVPRGNDDRHTGISNEVADVFVVFLAFYSLIACVFGVSYVHHRRSLLETPTADTGQQRVPTAGRGQAARSARSSGDGRVQEEQQGHDEQTRPKESRLRRLCHYVGLFLLGWAWPVFCCFACWDCVRAGATEGRRGRRRKREWKKRGRRLWKGLQRRIKRLFKRKQELSPQLTEIPERRRTVRWEDELSDDTESQRERLSLWTRLQRGFPWLGTSTGHDEEAVAETTTTTGRIPLERRGERRDNTNAGTRREDNVVLNAQERHERASLARSRVPESIRGPGRSSGGNRNLGLGRSNSW